MISQLKLNISLVVSYLMFKCKCCNEGLEEYYNKRCFTCHMYKFRIKKVLNTIRRLHLKDNKNFCIYRKTNREGYMLIRIKINNQLKFVKEHIVLYQRYYDCCILKGVDIHHINKVKTDNRKSNLLALLHEKHWDLHREQNKYIKNKIFILKPLNYKMLDDLI